MLEEGEGEIAAVVAQEKIDLWAFQPKKNIGQTSINDKTWAWETLVLAFILHLLTPLYLASSLHPRGLNFLQCSDMVTLHSQRYLTSMNMSPRPSTGCEGYRAEKMQSVLLVGSQSAHTQVSHCNEVGVLGCSHMRFKVSRLGGVGSCGD